MFQDGGLNTSGETDNDIPKFITDNNDKTNYVRGKFLGKVKSINLPGKRGVKNMSFGRGVTGQGLLVKVMLSWGVAQTVAANYCSVETRD